MRRSIRLAALTAVVIITLASCSAMRAPGSYRTRSGLRLSTVNGITVNSQIAGSLSRMVYAARRSGIGLTGGGYRSSASQIRLRRANCGTSYWAIYQKSSSSCHPPTARPGSSMHEQGLAIDFNRSSTRYTAVYHWLRAYAWRYGFYNLPSEPWHWSVNGH